MANNFPNTSSGVDGVGINSGLSTQIIIKVDKNPVGALQSLSVAQARPLMRVKEIGTDGVIEIVPNDATTFELTANRIVFDELRLPEAFSRGFRFINSQRLPFDIDVMDLSGTASNDSGEGTIVTMTYKNCWFTSYDTPYAADNYLITETARIWCETAYVSNPTDYTGNLSSLRGIIAETDVAGVEMAVNLGDRRGSMDAAGIFNAVFGTTEEE